MWGTAQRLAEESQVDRLVILTACYFHDIVSLPKTIPSAPLLGDGGRKTLAILQSSFPDFPRDRYPAVYHAIEAHSFSAGISPQSAEAKIVQMPIGWRHSAQLDWPASSRCPGH